MRERKLLKDTNIYIRRLFESPRKNILMVQNELEEVEVEKNRMDKNCSKLIFYLRDSTF